MLAEIFFLQLEATLRANNEESAHAPKFVPFDLTTVPGSKKPRARPSGGFAVAWALNPHVGFKSLSILHSNLRRVDRLSSLPCRKHNRS
jgi:hypothetical protein